MEIRYCCPDKYQFGDCEGDGYEWTQYFNSDDATQDGDWELIKSFSPSDVCQNPIAVQGLVSFKRQHCSWQKPNKVGCTRTLHLNFELDHLKTMLIKMKP